MAYNRGPIRAALIKKAAANREGLVDVADPTSILVLEANVVPLTSRDARIVGNNEVQPPVGPFQDRKYHADTVTSKHRCGGARGCQPSIFPTKLRGLGAHPSRSAAPRLRAAV